MASKQVAGNSHLAWHPLDLFHICAVQWVCLKKQYTLESGSCKQNMHVQKETQWLWKTILRCFSKWNQFWTQTPNLIVALNSSYCSNWIFLFLSGRFNDKSSGHFVGWCSPCSLSVKWDWGVWKNAINLKYFSQVLTEVTLLPWAFMLSKYVGNDWSANCFPHMPCQLQSRLVKLMLYQLRKGCELDLYLPL